MADTQLEKIKRRLGISDMEQDDLLNDLLEDAQSYFIAITGTITVDPRYEFIINDVTAKLYNRKGSEGMESESVDGYSTSYAQDLFSDYMGILERDFNLNDEYRQKRSGVSVLKTPHTIKLYERNGTPQYDPITDTYSDDYELIRETPCLANYISQQRVFELYGDRTNRVLIVRFSQEQQPFDRAEFDGRSFVPIEAIDAPIKGAVRLKGSGGIMAGFSIEWDGLTELGDVLAKAMRESESKVKTVIYNNGEKAKAKAVEWAPKPGGSRYGLNPYAEGPLSQNITHKHNGLNSEIHAEVGYSGFVNFGTRYMRAQPFMTDTFNWVVKFLEQDIKDVAEGLFV